MTTLLKKLSLKKSKPPGRLDDTQHGKPELLSTPSSSSSSTTYDDDRYEQQHRQSHHDANDNSSRPSLLMMPVGTPGNAGRHPSKDGLGDIPMPDPMLERNLELDSRVAEERRK